MNLLYPLWTKCPELRRTILLSVGVLKALFKLTLLLVLGAAMAGIVMMVKKPKSSGPVSYEQWPDVARNPAA